MGKIKNQSAAEMYAVLKTHQKLYAAAPSSMLALTIENLSKRAKAKLDEEMATAEKRFSTKHFGSEWWELAAKQYPITLVGDKYLVTSTVSLGEPQSWLFTYMFEALEKVEQLVRWKDKDRRCEIGSKDADLKKWSTQNTGLLCSRAQPECCSCGD